VVVKNAEKSAIDRNTPTENTNTGNYLSANPASARDLITVLSKTNECGCHELFPGHSMVMERRALMSGSNRVKYYGTSGKYFFKKFRLNELKPDMIRLHGFFDRFTSYR